MTWLVDCDDASWVNGAIAPVLLSMLVEYKQTDHQQGPLETLAPGQNPWRIHDHSNDLVHAKLSPISITLFIKVIKDIYLYLWSSVYIKSNMAGIPRHVFLAFYSRGYHIFIAQIWLHQVDRLKEHRTRDVRICDMCFKFIWLLCHEIKSDSFGG